MGRQNFWYYFKNATSVKRFKAIIYEVEWEEKNFNFKKMSVCLLLR